MTVSVNDLQYVALAVPNLAAERTFFSKTWGLEEVAEVDGKVYFATAASPHPYVIRLREDEEKKTDLIGFTANSRPDLDALFAQVKAAGAKIITEPGPAAGPGGGYAFRFFDPDGRALEIVADTTPRAIRKVDEHEAIPLQISHVVLHSPQHAELERWYREVLGFRLSDWLGDFMVFLRCNPAHHRLAILPGPPALNHIAFDVASIDALMKGLGRMTQAGVHLQWGPGRHTAGNNTFSYYSTPNDNTVEYTSDLETVDEESWQPTVYKPGLEVMDQWGTGRIIPGNRPHAEMAPDKGLWQVPA
ncbi:MULTISPECIES: VOC family protein [unclassified Novosphingobium]|uniref:VOC family protein n=1 Tax=unclassified Novosphingobium TaxID=2644732 RepID=UPI00020EF3E5|nr:MULTISPECIES: VOC family protein [unclassified Novosphingobium]GFM27294.1 bleomycin resistance protein [Novosphingobium sp. PY1]CCA94030.1 glyoxalase/bleomycin resistance protein/dioxygenase [Novosphingobium sp. PP1Y]